MKLRHRKQEGIPVLKLPPVRLHPVLTALRNHEFDRNGFKGEVVSLFSRDLPEKSVFRGMAVPSLRALGLMVGFEAELRLSSDGALVVTDCDQGSFRAMAAILVEIEREHGLDGPWRSRAAQREAIVNALCAVDSGAGRATAETRRRAQRWMAYLEHFRVFAAQASGLCVRQRLGALGLVSLQEFARRLLEAYRTAVPNCIGEVAVPVDQLRRDVGASFLSDGVFVTRRRFDMLLGRALARQLRSVDLHRSMGAGEQLFQWRGGAFEALSLRRDRDV